MPLVSNTLTIKDRLDRLAYWLTVGTDSKQNAVNHGLRLNNEKTHIVGRLKLKKPHQDLLSLLEQTDLLELMNPDNFTIVKPYSFNYFSFNETYDCYDVNIPWTSELQTYLTQPFILPASQITIDKTGAAVRGYIAKNKFSELIFSQCVPQYLGVNGHLEITQSNTNTIAVKNIVTNFSMEITRKKVAAHGGSTDTLLEFKYAIEDLVQRAQEQEELMVQAFSTMVEPDQQQTRIEQVRALFKPLLEHAKHDMEAAAKQAPRRLASLISELNKHILAQLDEPEPDQINLRVLVLS